MATTVRSIVLWRREIENQPGALASTLEPFASAGADLQIIMGYRYPGNQAKAAVELSPIVGKKLATAAETAGFKASGIPALLVEGDNKPGLGHAITEAIADAKINLDFLVTQVIGRRYSAVIGFESAEDAKKAATLIKKTTTRKVKKTTTRKRK
ncbi:ACT domain-containing protein [Edaphobacter bradus]|uniref:hypothetical protein n=1 Tax=Edaphobacter bradus TaxID=2259016 RepID=UPI0021DFDFCB|nr:hypothetical protein [Edaphobacter bradus]